MRTLNLNKKQVLFGLLVLTLGLSKSWLQTADQDFSTRSFSLASESGELQPSGRSGQTRGTGGSRLFELTYNYDLKGCNSKKAIVELVTEVGGPREEWNGQEWVVSHSRQQTVFAKYTFECKALDLVIEGKVEITDADRITSTDGLIDAAKPLVKEDIEEQVKGILEARSEEEAVANCEISEDGKDLLDDKHMKERYGCLSRKVRSISDRDERRTAFQTDIVDSLQEALMNSKSEAERRQIMAAITEVKRSVGYDSVLKTDVSFLEKGAKMLNTIPALAMDSAMNPNNAYNNNLAIDRMAWDFNFKSNRQLGKYSEGTQSMIRDWSNIVMPLASTAQRDPDRIVQEFFDNVYRDGMGTDTTGERIGDIEDGGRINGGRSNGQPSQSGTRSSRVNTGMRYIPEYLNTYDNRSSMNNRGGRGAGGPYANRSTTGGSGPRVYDPRTGQQVSGPQDYRNGGGYRQQSSQFNNNFVPSAFNNGGQRMMSYNSQFPANRNVGGGIPQYYR